MIDDRVDEVLHDFELVFLGVALDLIDDVLHGIDEILETHLVLVNSCPHDLYED